MRRIAAKCGIALGTLYNYYSNKRELFNQVYRTALSQTHQQVDQIIQQDIPPKERLIQVLELIYCETISKIPLWTSKYALDLSDQFLEQSDSSEPEPEIPGLDINLVHKVEHLIDEAKVREGSDSSRLARTLLDSISVCFGVDHKAHEQNKAYLLWLVECLWK